MTARRGDLADLPDWPRLLSREQAAAYLGVTPPTFDRLVKRRMCPTALPGFGRRRLWDRQQLDAAVDRLGGGGAPSLGQRLREAIHEAQGAPR